MSTFSLLYTVANGLPGTNDRQKTNDEEHLTISALQYKLTLVKGYFAP